MNGKPLPPAQGPIRDFLDVVAQIIAAAVLGDRPLLVRTVDESQEETSLDS